MYRLSLRTSGSRLPLPSSRRLFSKSSISQNKIDLSKELDELVNIKLSTETEKLPKISEETLATSKLIKTFKNYNPKTITEETITPGVASPIPINAELNYYSPLKHEVKYGDLKAEVVFKCYDPKNMEFFCDFALRAAYYLGLPATGPKPIATRRERWTVIKAPFVHAKSKENFERKTHGRIIKIWDSNNEVIDLWLSYLKKNSVWGVGVKVNMYTREPLGLSKKMEKVTDGKHVLTDLSSTLESLSKDITNPVSQKVLELLSDPIFTKHMTQKEIDEIKSKSVEK